MKMSTTSFPQGWFYIACAHRPDHVLTVANMTMQPSTRVELRPKKQQAQHNHQLWCYHEGYLVNKHSGCVLGIDIDKKKYKDQYVFQTRRSVSGSIKEQKRQKWKYDQDKRLLILTDDNDKEFALNIMMVPKLEELQVSKEEEEKEQEEKGYIFIMQNDLNQVTR